MKYIQLFFVIALTNLLSSVLVQADVAVRSETQQLDDQEVGACIIGDDGLETCIEETKQQCMGIGSLWREGKCPPSNLSSS
jgi:hypothetical protein